MKQTLCLLTATLFLLFSASAQEHKCASHEYMMYLDQLYPGLAQYVKDLPKQVDNGNYKKTRAEVITIPVVVHIVYNNAAQNLTDDYVTAQIDLLNKSFLRKNADTTNLRTEFIPYAGRANFQFMLVQTVRKSTVHGPFMMDTWQGYNYADDVKSTANGGSDAINSDKKLNIWVCDIKYPTAGSEILGYAYPPVGLPNWGGSGVPSGSTYDGVVIDYMAFGGDTKLPKWNAAYGCKGKTAVHEVGHYLGLRHIWGDDNGECQGGPNYEDDGVSDTPIQGDQSASDCNKTKNSCNQGATDLKDMVENYMDYSLESCQNTFTKGQVSIMESVLANQRLLVRVPVGVDDIDISSNIIVYPNPADNLVNVGVINVGYEKANIYLCNSVGQIVRTKTIGKSNNSVSFDVHDLPKGMYFIKTVLDEKLSNNQKIIVH